MKDTNLHRIKTIREYHQFMGHSKPLHPLISVINLDLIQDVPFDEPLKLVYDFYCITLKKNIGIKYSYGQQEYDFHDGTMFFMAPNQVFGFLVDKGQAVKLSGWALLIHPDFLWGTTLAKDIKKFDYFDYSANEALHLSEKEEVIITNIVRIIEQEYNSTIDKFSQGIIVTQIESLLTYADRFYQRQFVTRKKANHKILNELEIFLSDYFKDNSLVEKGIPSVQSISDNLHVSSNYLSRLLHTITGKSTKEFINDKLIELAKEKLSTTNLTINEIAYDLGFEYPQSFSKFFKSKTNVSPLKFRKTFN